MTGGYTRSLGQASAVTARGSLRGPSARIRKPPPVCPLALPRAPRLARAVARHWHPLLTRAAAARAANRCRWRRPPRRRRCHASLSACRGGGASAADFLPRRRRRLLLQCPAAALRRPRVLLVVGLRLGVSPVQVLRGGGPGCDQHDSMMTLANHHVCNA
jgi:hypothetical protein